MQQTGVYIPLSCGCVLLPTHTFHGQEIQIIIIPKKKPSKKQNIGTQQGPLIVILVMEIMEMFYLTTHSTHFIYGYMVSGIWLWTILIVRKETCCHMGYSFRLTARVLLYAPSHRQDSTYHVLCYTSHGALAGTRNSSMGPPLVVLVSNLATQKC